MTDFNEAAASTVQAVIDRTEPPKRQKNLAAVALGRLGGARDWDALQDGCAIQRTAEECATSG